MRNCKRIYLKIEIQKKKKKREWQDLIKHATNEAMTESGKSDKSLVAESIPKVPFL